MVRGGGGGNNRVLIVSFMLDVECVKIAADKAEEEFGESDEAAFGAFLFIGGGGEWE